MEEIAQLKKNVHALQIDKRSLTITIRHMEEQSAKQDRQYEEMLINNVCLIKIAQYVDCAGNGGWSRELI